MEQEQQRPRVGLGIMIFKDGKVLMGKRKTSHGIGEYAFPGGHVEYLESFEDCARRETLEEAGIIIKNIQFLHVGNIFHYAPKHYVNVVLRADWESGEPQVLEPEKLESWAWYDIDRLPSPVFIQTGLAIESYKTGEELLRRRTVEQNLRKMKPTKKKSNKKAKGKFIVIDGTDGSGKATQVAILTERLKKEGFTVKNVDFPEYYENFFGKFIGHCLSEQYYNFVKVHPKIASVLYAADRFESKDKINEWLGKGYVVIANRYVSANQIHQGGKIKNAKKRQAFIEWLDEMEYEIFKIPRPDVVFYLNLPMKVILSLIKERNKKGTREYLGKKKDIVEGNIEYLLNSRKSALWLAKTQPNYIKIECSKKEEICPREDIHDMIYEKVEKMLR